MQREKLRQPKKGRETEEILGREGVTPQHKGTGQLRRKVTFFSKSGGKKYGSTNGETDIARILFWQGATGEGMREFSLIDLNLLRKMEDKVMC